MVSRRYITVAEAAEHLQISEKTVRRLIADGELTGYRIGRSSHAPIRIDLDEIDELNANSPAGPSPANS